MADIDDHRALAAQLERQWRQVLRCRSCYDPCNGAIPSVQDYSTISHILVPFEGHMTTYCDPLRVRKHISMRRKEVRTA